METPSLVEQHWGHHFISGSLSAFRMELDNLKEEEYSRAVIYGSLKVLDSGCPELLIADRAGGSAQPSSAVRFGSRVKSA